VSMHPGFVKLCRSDDLSCALQIVFTITITIDVDVDVMSGGQDEFIGRGTGSAAEADASRAEVVGGQVVGKEHSPQTPTDLPRYTPQG